MLPRRPRLYPNRRSARTLLRGGGVAVPPPPPPPPTLLHVSEVRVSGDDRTVATWMFDEDINDPTSAINGLLADGHVPLNWHNESANELRVEYEFEIAEGAPWSNPAGAGGIVSTSGHTLAAGSGTVTEG